ncbi:MAG: proton-conducting transporter membrane subunit [Acidimicrobiales bacterium]
MSRFLPLAVVIPLAGAVLTLATVRVARAQRIIGVVTALATLGWCIAIAVSVDRDGTLHAVMGDWPAPIGINMVADRFAAMMLVIGSAMLAAVLVFAIGARASDERSPWYQPAYMVLMAGVSAAFLAGDLFNFFVAVEILLMSSYVLITLEGVDDQIRSGTTYIVINVLESILLVMAVALVFAATGTLSMADLPARLAALPDGVRLGLNLLLLLAFGLKAAVFPLFSWLPDSYPAAPSPVTAVFAGLLTKIGVYAMVRTETLLFPGSLRTVLLVIAGLTMVVGVLGAIAQSDMKRILSFHIVSQIGYMVMGLALGGAAAIAATIFFILHQIPIKTSLFLVEGIVERDTGSSILGKVSGLARRSGWLALLFLLSSLSLAGLPPFSGFIGKVGLAEAAVDQGQWWILAVSLAVSVLTLVSMLKIWTGLFWGPSNTRGAEGGGMLRHHPLMSGITVGVVGIGLAIALAAGPLYRYCERAAESIVNPVEYETTVNGQAAGR